MNFKDKIRKPAPQQQTNNWNQPIRNDNLFKRVTNQLASQQFQPGQLRGIQSNQNLGHRRNKSSRVIQQDYNQQDIQTQQQNYYITERPISNRNQRTDRNSQKSNTNIPITMINSNVNANDNNYNGSLLDSKLHQTISQQIYGELSKKQQKQMQQFKSLFDDYITRQLKKFKQQIRQEQRDNLQSLATQINKNQSIKSKKIKQLQTNSQQTQQKMQQLHKQFNDFNIQIQQKMEKLMNSNSNAEIAASMKKSMSRNMGNNNNDYLVQLKSSIKQIPIANNPLVQQIKGQIYDIQQTLKSIKLQFSTLKQQIKTKTMNVIPIQKQKQKKIEPYEDPNTANKIKSLEQEINKLKLVIENVNSQCKGKLKQYRQVLVTQDENLQGMNDQLGKVINTQLIPRLKKVQQQLQSQPQILQKHAQQIKKQTIKQLQSMPIIRIRSNTDIEKQKIQKMKNLSKKEQQIYMLDQSNYILDCFGNYLVDQNNQRIKIQEQQIYYLQQIQGIQIKLPALQAK